MDIIGKITGIKLLINNFTKQQMYFIDALMDEAGENGFEVRITN